MKQTSLALTLALGLVAPGLAYAANNAGDGNAIYERDLAIWSGTGLNNFKAPHPASKMVCQTVKKAHFAYDNIYAHDLAVSAGADNGNTIYERDLAIWSGTGLNNFKAPRLASKTVCLAAKKAHFAYDNIYAHDLAITTYVLASR